MFETANKVLLEPLQVEAGQAVVPQGVGLGIQVNEDFVRAHSSQSWLIGAAK